MINLIRKSCIAALLSCAWLPLTVVAQEPYVQTLVQELGFRESSIPSKDMPGWQRPTRISILTFRPLPESGLGSAEWLRSVSDGVEVDFFDPEASGNDFSSLKDSDVLLGWCSPGAIAAAGKLRYLHIYSAGIDRCSATPAIAERDLIATNSAKAASETIAEHSIAMMLMLTRNLHFYRSQQADGDWTRNPAGAPAAISVKGKTMLVLGLGGIGSQVAKRGHDLGMRVVGTRNSSRNGPDYVAYVGLSDETNKLAAEADVIVNALPLTDTTRGSLDEAFFSAAKTGAYYISVGRGATTNTAALIAALKNGQLAGAGLDVTDPEPLPADHELWALSNVVISPHSASASDLSERSTMILARENLRRYVRGEKLLNIVDLKRGY